MVNQSCRASKEDITINPNTKLYEKFLQFVWLRAMVFSALFAILTCENYKPFAGSSIDK